MRYSGARLFILPLVLLPALISASRMSNHKLRLSEALFKRVTSAFYAGRATWYDPDGGQGDCGSRIATSDMAVALATVDYAHGAHCGKNINVHYKNATITVTVLDECPECDKGNIELTRGAFSKFADDFEEGVLEVTWEPEY